MDPQQGPPQPDLFIGVTVGNYRVTEKLGEGGMGSVYLAEHPTIGKRVALKVLHAEYSNNEEVAKRFFTEAKSVNNIGHPNIVDIIDYGVIQAGPNREQLLYFIMEYLAGVTLSQLIRTDAPLPPERALTIALQVADALAAAHRCGIVHRDLKPDNIILMQRGREQDFVKLLDFGIAKLTGSDGASSHKTRTGLVLGTPAYMSPEQCEGRANVDHRTDIYALGICLYEMLVGRVPFIGEGYGEILVQHLTQQPIEPSRYRMMSPHVEQVVLKALEKRPDLRYPTMDEFMRAMADPVGYVEAHGGVGEFRARQLMPSTAPLPPIRLTPSPLTPIPGISTPPPGTLVSPSPTTLSAAAGEAEDVPARSRTGFIIAGLIVVAAAAVGVLFVLKDNKDKTDGSGSGSSTAMGSGSDTHATDPGSGSETKPDKGDKGSAETPPEKGSNAAPEKGSNATVEKGSNGSATTPPPPAKVTLSIHSKPPGAEIFIDNKDTGKKTDAELTLDRSAQKPTIVLRLKGFDDYVIKDVSLDTEEVKQDVALKKPGTGHSTGHGTGHGSGKGSAKACDTCLEKPD